MKAIIRDLTRETSSAAPPKFVIFSWSQIYTRLHLLPSRRCGDHFISDLRKDRGLVEWQPVQPEGWYQAHWRQCSGDAIQSDLLTTHYQIEHLYRALSGAGVEESTFHCTEEWDESKDAIVAEQRGSAIVEGYIDPNDSGGTQFLHQPPMYVTLSSRQAPVWPACRRSKRK